MPCCRGRYTWDFAGCKVCLDCGKPFEWSELCKIHKKPVDAGGATG